jgi:predicted RNA-binding protein with PIN domain
MISWLLIDGYSLLHRDPVLAARLSRDLPGARRHLVRRLSAVAGGLAEKTTIVFDGRAGGSPEEAGDAGLEVLFSPPHQTADTVIERLVGRAAEPGAISVVTADRGEQETVSAAGARVISCAQFLDLCREQEARGAGRTARPASPPATLGDYFPAPAGPDAPVGPD